MLTTKLLSQAYQKTKLVATLKKFYGRHHDLVNPYSVAVSRIVSDVFANDEPEVEFRNPGHTLLPTFLSFRPMGMVGEACLPNNAYYPRTTDYTLHSGIHVCWSELSDSSFDYGFMSLDYGLCTMTTTTYSFSSLHIPIFRPQAAIVSEKYKVLTFSHTKVYAKKLTLA